jgi:hypothetical protein
MNFSPGEKFMAPRGGAKDAELYGLFSPGKFVRVSSVSARLNG